MVIPFTVAQFFGVFRDYNLAVWPAQLVLLLLALVALMLVWRPGRRSGMVISTILAILWAWIAIVYHLRFFTQISVAAYGFAAVSMVGSLVFLVQGVVRRQLEFQWVAGYRAYGGLALIVFALVVYPFGSVMAGHTYPTTPTFGLPCPTTIFTVGLLCLMVSPIPRSTLVVPVLWCFVGAQAAFSLDLHPDWGLVPTALLGIFLLVADGQKHKVSRP
jgi:hypothetical protein